MLSTILVDDEMRSCEILQKLISKNCTNIEVLGVANDVESAYRLIIEKNPTLVFLDVEMEGESGFQLLRKFQQIPFKIIFVTAHLHYAIKAIKYSAVDYLLKPVDSDDLKEAVNKITLEIDRDNSVQYRDFLKNLEIGAVFKLAIPVKDGLVYLNPEEIIRMEADRAYTIFYTTEKEFLASKNIKEYETILGEEMFFRAHNSHLINLNHVKKFIRDDGFYALMSDGSKVEISRRRKEEFLEVMLHHQRKVSKGFSFLGH